MDVGIVFPARDLGLLVCDNRNRVNTSKDKELEMTQLNMIGRTATKVFGDTEGTTEVFYHDTLVVSFDEKAIRLNNGGYFTNTTKTRMNQTSDMFHLGYQVYQEKYNWFVNWNSKTYPFVRYMTLDRLTGKVVVPGFLTRYYGLPDSELDPIAK